MVQRLFRSLVSGIFCGLCISMSVSLALAAPASELIPGWQDFDPASTVQINHQPFDQFLQKYRKIEPSGIALIAYQSVTAKDQKQLKAYLDRLQQVDVLALNRDEQFAYWVNLYNSATLSLILKHRPKSSIRDINISPGFFTIGPWGKTFLTVAGQNLSLDNIEHGILRPIWKDPRAHYVLNCAAMGCPDIPKNALRADTLKKTLDTAARAYINHPRGARLNGDKTVTLSSIYKWFSEDFGENDRAILDHLLTYADPDKKKRLEKTSEISRYRYDWSLNGTAWQKGDDSAS